MKFLAQRLLATLALTSAQTLAAGTSDVPQNSTMRGARQLQSDEHLRAVFCLSGLPKDDACCRTQCGECGGPGCGGRGENCCASALAGPSGRPCRFPRDINCAIPRRGLFCQGGRVNGNLCCPRSCRQCGGSGCGAAGQGCCSRGAELCRTFGQTGCLIPPMGLDSSQPSDCSAETCTWFRAGVVASSGAGTDFDQVTDLIQRFGAKAGELSPDDVILAPRTAVAGLTRIRTRWIDGWQRANGFTAGGTSLAAEAMDCLLDQDVFITSHRNQQLQDRNGAVRLDPGTGTSQRWKLSDAGRGRVFITSHRNQQLEDRNGALGIHPDRGTFQGWSVSNAGDGRVFITSHRNEQLEDRNGRVGVHEDRGNWQRWRISLVDGEPACERGGVGPIFTSTIGSDTRQSRAESTSQWDHVFFYSRQGAVQQLEFCESDSCRSVGATRQDDEETTVARLFIPVQQGEVFRGFYGRWQDEGRDGAFSQLGMYWGPDVWGVPQVVQVDTVPSPDLPPPPPLMWMPVTRSMMRRCSGLGRLLCGLVRGIGSIARGAVRLIRTVGNFVVQTAMRIVELAVDLVNDVVSVGRSLAQGIVSFFQDPVGTIRNFLECLTNPQRDSLNLLPFCGEGSSVSVGGTSLSATCTGFLGGLGNLGRCFRLCTNGSPFGAQSGKLPGTESEMEMLGSAMTRPDESTDMRSSMSRGNGCQGGLNMSFDVNAELNPTISMSIDLSGQLHLTIKGMASVSIQALFEAEGNCAYRANRSFPESPPVKTACVGVFCVVISLQAFAEVNVSGMLTGSVAMRANADLEFSTTVMLRAGRQSNVQSNSSAERSAGLEVVASAAATIQFGLGPHIMIWLVPGAPVDILPLVVAEARGSGTFEFLQESASNRRLMAAGAARESGSYSGRALRETSIDHFPGVFADESGDNVRSLRGALAMHNSSSHVSHESRNDSPIFLLQEEAVTHAGRKLQSATPETCVGFALNVRGLLRISGLGIPQGFIQILDLPALIAMGVESALMNIANFLSTSPLGCIPFVGEAADRFSSSIARAVTDIASFIPDAPGFASFLATLNRLLHHRELGCNNIFGRDMPSGCAAELRC